MRTFEDVKVGAAHAGAPDPDQRFARPGRRLGALDDRQSSGLDAEQGAQFGFSRPLDIVSYQ